MIKKVVIFCLLIVVINGQDIQNYRFKPDTIGCFDKGKKYKSTQFTIPGSFATVVTIVAEWEKYKKECYQDSILVTKNEFFVTDTNCVRLNGQSIIGSGYERIVEEWVHKKPTFEGFVEYLKNKLKINND